MLCVLCLVLTVRAFTQEGFKEVLLKRLGLSEAPKLHKRDLVDLVIPDHVKNKYMSMLKRQRVKRRALPSLAGILRGIPGNAGNVSAASLSGTGRAPCPCQGMGRGKPMAGSEVWVWLQTCAGWKRWQVTAS